MSARQLLEQAPEVGVAEAYPEPWPFAELGDITPLREYPLGKIFPPALEEYAAAFAERTRVPVGVVVMAYAATATAVLNGRYFVEPDTANPTWREPTALWVAAVMPVSAKKSPVLKSALGALYSIEQELREEYREELARYEVALEQWQGGKKGERGERPQKPREKRLVVGDSTKEKLADLLAQNFGLIAGHDELKGLFSDWRRRDHESDRSAYIAFYSAAPYVQDRIMRGATYIEAPVLSLLGFIQPGPFREIVREAVVDGGGADGLLQRFVLVTGEPMEWVDERPPIEASAIAAYYRLVRGIWARFGEGDTPRTLRFGPEAQTLWYEWEGTTERAIRNPEAPAAWRAYLGKRMGLTARLAAVLGILWGEDETLSATALRRAIALVLWLEPHARRVWHRALNGDDTPVLKLARKLRAGELGEFTARDLYRRNIAGIENAGEARRVLGILTEAGWVLEAGGKYRPNPRTKEAP